MALRSLSSLFAQGASLAQSSRPHTHASEPGGVRPRTPACDRPVRRLTPSGSPDRLVVSDTDSSRTRPPPHTDESVPKDTLIVGEREQRYRQLANAPRAAHGRLLRWHLSTSLARITNPLAHSNALANHQTLHNANHSQNKTAQEIPDVVQL